MNLESERSLLGEEGSGCCVEGTGSGACGPWLNRVINVPANIRLAFGGARGKFHSSPVGELRQPRTIVDIITRLIKHYNCKSTEICHGRLRHCGCPLQTRLFHSLSLSLCLFSKYSLLHLEETTEWNGARNQKRCGGGKCGENVWCIDFGNVDEEVNWIELSLIEFDARWRACIEIKIRINWAVLSYRVEKAVRRMILKSARYCIKRETLKYPIFELD